MVGETLAGTTDAGPGLRVYLAGGIALRAASGATLGEHAFPGRQARRLFVHLAALHEPAPHVDLAEDLWETDWPATWEVSLRALVSKVRGLLAQVGAADAITSRDGAYVLHFPAGTWLDLDAAGDAIHRAEVARAAGDDAAAGPWALAARAIASRSLLPGEEAEWLEGLRRRLTDVRLRALECLGAIWIARGDPTLAARDAVEAIGIDPFREGAHRLLIRAHLAAGDRAAAARALAALRTLLAEELGVSPSRETLELLAADR